MGELQSFGHMFEIVVVGSVEDLALAKVVEGLIKLELIFGD